MENSIANAEAFYKLKSEEGTYTALEMLTLYAASITPTKLEQHQSARTKIAEALDREYETRPPIRIVVPSEGRITNWIFDLVPDLEDDADFSLYFKRSERRMMMKTANLIVSTIRTLNPGAEVVEGEGNNSVKN